MLTVPPPPRPPLLMDPFGQYPTAFNKNEPPPWTRNNGPFAGNDPGDVAHTNPNQLDAQSKSGIDISIDNVPPAPSLDAAQRKSLPAWIR